MTIGIYVPARGDVAWLDLFPQAGHEQSGRRPALCISPRDYNSLVGLAIFCPITSHAKGYPFEVVLPQELPVTGVVLADQVKSLDWRSRKAEYVCKVTGTVIEEVLTKLRALL